MACFADLQLSSALPLDKKLNAIEQFVVGRKASLSASSVECIIIFTSSAFNKVSSNGQKRDLLNILSSVLQPQTSNEKTTLSSNSIAALINLTKNLEFSDDMENFVFPVIHLFLSSPSVRTYMLQNDKILLEVFSLLAGHLKLEDAHCNSILSLFSQFYQSLSNREKVFTAFVKKSSHPLGKLYLANIQHRQKVVHFCRSLIFGKDAVEKFSNFLESLFTSKEVTDGKYLALFATMSEIAANDEMKAAFYRLVIEAYASLERVDDTSVIRLAIVLAHLLGIEQSVELVIEDKKRCLLDAEFVSSVFKIPEKSDKASLETWSEVVDILAKKSLNLRTEVYPDTTGVQWFRGFLSTLFQEKNPSPIHIKMLTSLLVLDSSIVEPALSKSLSWVLRKHSKLGEESYLKAYYNFLDTSLQSFTRLQRVHKFIAKLLQSLSSLTNEIELERVIPSSFIDQLSTITTILPSAHAILLLNTLCDFLKQCIDKFESDNLNTTFLHAVTSLLISSLSGCRLLCFSLPRAIIVSFEELFQKLTELLAHFGTLILMRPHDRQIMQPFLKICHVWGDLYVMVCCYGTKDEPPSLSKDSAPSDLSPLLSYISGDQWSVFAERITNFGDKQCNECLMKLIIQKLRVARLSGDKSLINIDGTAKFIVAKLKSNVHDLNLIDMMKPEELNIILDTLPDDDAKYLVDKFFHQLIICDQKAIKRWIDDPRLFDNKKLVKETFDTALKSLLDSVTEKNSATEVAKLLKSLSKKTTSHLAYDDSFRESVKSKLRDALCLNLSQLATDVVHDRIRNACLILNNLPASELSSAFGCAALIHVTVIMVGLNLCEPLLPIFYGLISVTQDVPQCFDVSLLVVWFVKNLRDRTARSSVLELLILKSTSTPQGLIQFKSLVASLKRSDSLTASELIETQVLVYNCIRKCFGTGKRYAETNDVLGQQKKCLTKSLKKTLKSSKEQGEWSWALLDAYAIELMNADRRGNMKKIVALNFHSYLNHAIIAAKDSNEEEANKLSSQHFLITVLKCAANLRKDLNDDFVYKIWKELKDEHSGDLWQFICPAASEREFKKIMEDILQAVQSGLLPPKDEHNFWDGQAVLPKHLRPLFVKKMHRSSGQWSNNAITIWQTFLTKATGKKQKICKEAVKELIKDVVNILPSSDLDSFLGWLKFLHTCTTCSRGQLMTSQMHDYLLDVILATPQDNFNLEIYKGSIDLLSAIINPRAGYFKEKIPLIFQAFRKLVDWLVKESDSNLNLEEEKIAERATAGFHLEKWTSMLIKLDVGREIPFFISELINSITAVTLSSPIKIHVKNAIFNLLTQTDEHSIQYLMRVLPAGSQQVFTNLYRQYQRFYKFKGKI